MLSLLATLWSFWTFVTDHALVIAGLLLALAGLWVRFGVPGLGPKLATALWILSAGLVCYGQGYATARSRDRTALLQEHVNQLLVEARNTQQVAQAAAARAEAAEANREADHAKVEALTSDLAAARRDCAIPDDLRERLRLIGEPVAHPQPAEPAPRLRPARRPAVDLKPGAIATLAAYRAALAEANRRLRNDRAFYDDVLRHFSRGSQ